MLVGRTREQAKLTELLAAAEIGRSRVLVLRGAAGIGKSVLLDYAIQQADGFLVLQVTAVESEAEIAFAGLHALLRPLLGALDAIPVAQARALRAALALEPVEQVERLAVYAGALSVLAEGAERVPLLAVVDDAHWLDQPSAEALAFIARRVEAESLALLFAVREGEAKDFGQGLPDLPLDPLAAEASRELLEQRFGAAIAPEVADRLVRATGGNPLGLLEFASLLGEAERAGREPLPDHLPVSESVERRVRLALQELPENTRRVLLLAAASDAPIGLETGLLEQAERAGLVRIHAGSLSFRHPLVRSAVYQAASAEDRRGAHRELAGTFSAGEDADRRAWHLAAAAGGPSEAVASELEAAASRFAERGGHASESRALERAAELSDDDDRRAPRLVSAALAAHRAGRSERALDLLAHARRIARDPLVRVDAAYLTSFIQAWRGIAVDQAEMERRARALASTEPRRAAQLLQHAANGAWIADFDLRRATVLLRDAAKLDERGATEVTGISIRGDLAQMLALVGHTSEAEAITDTERQPLLDIWLERYADARGYLESRLECARSSGDMASATVAALDLAYLEWLVGNFPGAQATATQALELAGATGWVLRQAQSHVILALVAAVQGRENDTRAHAMRAGEAFSDRPRAELQAEARIALGLLELGLGRSEAAVAHLRPVAELAAQSGLLEPSGMPYAADLIEAYARVGERDCAEQELDRLEQQAEAVNRRWALAAAARLRGFLAADEELDTDFDHALTLHEAGAGSAFDRARTELLYGERLRRAKRKTQAREQLRAAIARFDQLGAAPWSERARSELRASGGRIRRRDLTAPEKLTAQELQIALQVAEGKSNRGVATALFLSPKTVEYHLTRIYRKLDLHSRAELIRLFAAEPEVKSTLASQ